MASMKKWIIVSIYSIAAMLSSAAWTLFVPIASKTADHFSTSIMNINWLSLLYLALYIPGSLLCIVCTAKLGLRSSILWSCFGMFVGLWLKVASEQKVFVGNNPNFELLFLGQFIVALTSPVLTNASPRVSAVWMPANQRDIAVVIMNMCSFFGMSVGTAMGSDPDVSIEGLLLTQAIVGTIVFILAVIFFDEEPVHPPSASESFRRSITPPFINEAASAASASIGPTPIIAAAMSARNTTNCETSLSRDFYQESGLSSSTDDTDQSDRASSGVSEEEINIDYGTSRPTPASTLRDRHGNQSSIVISSTTPANDDAESVFESLDKVPIGIILRRLYADVMECFSNKSFVLLCMSTFMIGGVYNGVVVLVEAFAASIGYGSEEAGMFSNALVLSGIVTSFVLGFILDKTHAYATSYKLLFVFATISVIGLTYSFRPGELSSILVMFALLGAFTTPNAIVAFSLGAELTFPIKEDVSATVIASISQISGVPFAIILGELLEMQPDFDADDAFEYIYTPAYFFLLLSMIVGTILTMFIVEDNKRQRIEDDASIATSSPRPN